MKSEHTCRLRRFRRFSVGMFVDIYDLNDEDHIPVGTVPMLEFGIVSFSIYLLMKIAFIVN